METIYNLIQMKIKNFILKLLWWTRNWICL